MPCILHVETSGKSCSVALSLNGKLIAYSRKDEEKSHSAFLTIMINSVLSDAKVDVSELDAVSVSEGPGSYTGLRIGISVVKGICYGAKLPLIPISTLEIMYTQIILDLEKDKINTKDTDLYVPMIDARRMEVYDVVFDKNKNCVQEIKADIIDESSFQNLLEKHLITFFGDGSDKCRDIIKHENAAFLSGILPDAKYMLSLAEEKFAKKEFADIAYYEPFYLKEYRTTVPKNKVFKKLGIK